MPAAAGNGDGGARSLGLNWKASQSEAQLAGTRTVGSKQQERRSSAHRQDALRVDGVDFLLSKAARLDKALQTLPKADFKSLQASSHKRARKVLRSLSYPALPSGGHGAATADDCDGRAAQDQIDLITRAQNPAVGGTSTRKMRPLAEALTSGLESQAVRNFALEARQALAEDLCSVTVERTGASMDWVDVEGLLSTGSLVDQLPKATQELDPPGQKVESFPADAPGAEASMDTSQGHRWPSMETFEQFYHIPEELLPRPKKKAQGQQFGALPPALPTIAGIEDAKTIGKHAYLLPSLLSSAAGAAGIQDQHQQRPRTSSSTQGSTPQNVFAATAAYRDACSKLGVQPMSPSPLFGETLEILDGNIDGTKQCYAIAEGVKAAAPLHVVVIDAFLTDMGAATVVEAAFASGRLKSLRLSGSPLSYRTCLALHTCLRARVGASLQELSLAECGLGGDLEEDVDMLPGRAASTYARSRSSLFPDDEELETSADLEPKLPAVSDRKQSKDQVKEDKNSKSTDKKQPAVKEQTANEKDVERKISERAGAKSSADKEPKVEKQKKAAEAQSGKVEEDEENAENEDEEDDTETSEVEVVPTAVLLPLFAQLSRPTCSLQKLDLSRSILSQAAVEALTYSLRTTVLEVLVLDSCGLTDEAVDELAVSGIAQNRMLLELSLRCNNLSGEPGSACALLDAAGRHARLVHLDMADNLLPKECIKELCAMLRWSLSLVAIHLLGDNGSEQNNLAIQAACHRWIAETAGKEVGADGSLTIAEPEDGDEYKELILCRALHVEGLKEWRVASPAAKPASPEPRASAAQGIPEPVLTSWMPACCWICERCVAVDYTWEVPDKGGGDETGAGNARVFVRPSCADFARVELKRLRIAGARRLRFGARMLVPSGSHFHVYEAEVGHKRTLYCAESEPKIEMAEAALMDSQSAAFDKIRMKHCYSGLLNVRPVPSEDFQIPEDFPVFGPPPEPEADAWAEHPVRTRALMGCYEEDMKNIAFQDLCHADEEPDVKATLREKYHLYHECYALFSGRSQWPLVRQVDVYGAFEEARLLDRGPFGPPAKPDSPSSRRGPQGGTGDEQPEALPQLQLMDVQQMLVQTITNGMEDTGATRSPTTLSGKQAAEVAKRSREGAPVTRPQFIEVLLRAAIALRRREPSTALAFRRFADEVISGRILLPPLAPFPRGLAIRVGEFSDTILARRKVLREAWERFGASEVAFQRLPQLMKLCDRSFTAKHVASIYSIVRRPQPDCKPGQGKRGGQGLRYQEFCEAVARLALVWKRSGGNMGSSTSSSLRDDTPAREWSLQPQVGKPVREKAIAARLESFLARLADRMRPSIL